MQVERFDPLACVKLTGMNGGEGKTIKNQTTLALTFGLWAASSGRLMHLSLLSYSFPLHNPDLQ
jgi:hypothetical protein